MSTVVRKANRFQSSGIVTMAATLVACLAVANAADGTKGRLSAEDAKFVETAVRAGNTEVLEARLAQQQGSMERVKDAARQLERDHSAANDKLRRIAEARGARVTREPAEERRDEMHRLSQAKGQDFDREYIRTQVLAHRKSIELFEKQSKEGKDPELKAFATETLPTLNHHLDMMKELERRQTASK